MIDELLELVLENGNKKQLADFLSKFDSKMAAIWDKKQNSADETCAFSSLSSLSPGGFLLDKPGSANEIPFSQTFSFSNPFPPDNFNFQPSSNSSSSSSTTTTTTSLDLDLLSSLIQQEQSLLLAFPFPLPAASLKRSSVGSNLDFKEYCLFRRENSEDLPISGSLLSVNHDFERGAFVPFCGVDFFLQGKKESKNKDYETELADLFSKQDFLKNVKNETGGESPEITEILSSNPQMFYELKIEDPFTLPLTKEWATTFTPVPVKEAFFERRNWRRGAESFDTNEPSGIISPFLPPFGNGGEYGEFIKGVYGGDREFGFLSAAVGGGEFGDWDEVGFF